MAGTPRERAQKIADDFYAKIEQYAPPCVQDEDRTWLVDRIEAAIKEAPGQLTNEELARWQHINTNC